MGKGFNIADTFGEALKGVPNSGTAQITTIDVDELHGDPRNFYALTNLDELAASIELVGLQQPILVRPDPERTGEFIIVSGHRRRAAIKKLVDEGRDDLRAVPCIVQVEDVSPAMQELRLIYANADTRTLTSAEISQQVDRVRELLYQLKEQEHVKFPGRMRDHVAEACKVSKSKIARLDAIKTGLDPAIAKAYWFSPKDASDQLSEATAYELAKLKPFIQWKIISEALRPGRSARNLPASCVEHIREDLAGLAERACSRGGSCSHAGRLDRIIRERVKSCWSRPQCTITKCCGTCSELRTCKDACPEFASKQRQLREEHRVETAEAKAAAADAERPIIERTKLIWAHWDAARRQAGATEEDTFKASTPYWSLGKLGMADRIASGEERVTTSTYSPYSYNRPSDYDSLVRTAQYLGVTTDYLLGLSDEMRHVPPEAVRLNQPATPIWIPAVTPPDHPCECVVEFDLGEDHLKVQHKDLILCRWDGKTWLWRGDSHPVGMPAIRWCRIPPWSAPEEVSK